MSKLIDLTGQKFGRLTVIGMYGRNTRNQTTWECICDCGNTHIVVGSALRHGNTKTCGKCKKESTRRINMIGMKFGKLTVTALDHEVRKIYGQHKLYKLYWVCKCDCGNEKVICGSDLRRGDTKSCGCIKIDAAVKNIEQYNKHHRNGATNKETHERTRLYIIWAGMMRRCTATTGRLHRLYSGRGIRVCDEWTEYERFHEWALASGYKPHLSIDRIDVNGGYRPENCRWATDVEQANNRRSNRFIEYNGDIHTISEWERITGLPIRSRIDDGWSVERALTQKKRKVRNEQCSA